MIRTASGRGGRRRLNVEARWRRPTRAARVLLAMVERDVDRVRLALKRPPPASVIRMRATLTFRSLSLMVSRCAAAKSASFFCAVGVALVFAFMCNACWRRKCARCRIRHWPLGSPCSGASQNWTTERPDHILFKTEQPHHILIEPATSRCNLVVGAVPSHVPHQEWRYVKPG